MISPDPKMPRPQHMSRRAVFLSASVPSEKRGEKYRRGEDAAISIEEAVVAIARAVFSAGGELVFGAHPSISPLIASVVGEYAILESRLRDEKGLRAERESQPEVIMYQSMVWEPFWADSSRHLAEHRLVRIRWTPIIANETVSPERSAWPQAPRSMTEMRQHMIKETRPVAMIVIGGMEGTEEEANLFAEYCEGRPIFVLETTGGAASLIENKREIRKSPIIVVDKQDRDKVVEFWKSQEDRDPRFSGNQDTKEGTVPAPFRDRRYYVPYSFIAQQIIERIVNQNK